MEMTGEQMIPVAQDQVWTALNDPNVLKACIPGCETIDKVADNEYKVAMTASVGPVRAKFSGKLVLSNVNPPQSYSLAFEGSGGAAGFGKGSADVSLSPDGPGTKLTYVAKAQVGGKLAQVGSRLIDGVAKKMADDFFSRFKETVAPAAAAAVQPAAPLLPETTMATGAMAREQAAPSLNPIWIASVLIIAMFIIALAIGR